MEILEITDYLAAGVPELAFKDAYWQTRLEAYRTLGYNKEALKDKDWRIRLETYRALGFTKEALKDAHWEIRQGAYRALGRTGAPLGEEKSKKLRQETEAFFALSEQCDAMAAEDAPKYINSETPALRLKAGALLGE